MSHSSKGSRNVNSWAVEKMSVQYPSISPSLQEGFTYERKVYWEGLVGWLGNTGSLPSCKNPLYHIKCITQGSTKGTYWVPSHSTYFKTTSPAFFRRETNSYSQHNTRPTHYYKTLTDQIPFRSLILSPRDWSLQLYLPCFYSSNQFEKPGVKE